MAAHSAHVHVLFVPVSLQAQLTPVIRSYSSHFEVQKLAFLVLTFFGFYRKGGQEHQSYQSLPGSENACYLSRSRYKARFRQNGNTTMKELFDFLYLMSLHYQVPGVAAAVGADLQYLIYGLELHVETTRGHQKN
ncbi:hypothetical protein LENED_001041 [Lentinula edodes]|uniref:Uncharacterized protein n=1 Tax=Lentinula edodes TaxID=5353 RepID=A0A1Q3DX43_LENED|nr:hypothetical protein LENED_001041 [Lentinula edodes]